MHLFPIRRLRRWTWRLAVFAVLLGIGWGWGGAQDQAPAAMDAAAVVRRAVANRRAEDAAHRPNRFLFHKQDDRRNFTQEIIETPQGDVALLVAVNGNALRPSGRQVERNRLDALDKDPEMQAHRFRREQADAARVENLLQLLPDAFVYQYVDTISCDVSAQPDVEAPGVSLRPIATRPPDSCYHMTFKPAPNWDPPNIEAKIFRGMAGEIWIDATDDRLVRLNAHLISDVDFGWGIVGRLDKGGTVFLEQSKVGDHDWELTRMKLNLTGKALMVKPLSYHINEELADFAPVAPGTDYHQAIKMLEAAQPAASQ